ncbi:MAG: hypothetical protein OXQ29_19100, partial [Rhodospirillaceae bacterium]|nr:hypothetical protein [Rhodospirillaceae bacterium]
PADRAAGWSGSMKTVLEEVTSDAVDAEHVRRRVEDWEARLNGLYAKIGEWLPDGWEARRGAPVVMHAKMMERFGVEAKRLPTLELHSRSGQVVKLVPDALWIIGTNGRVDLKGDGGRYIMIDTADNFEEPRWEVSRSDRRSHREPVTREWLRPILQ